MAVVRRGFLRAFLRGLHVVWPVLSGLLVAIAGLGAVIGLLEGWGLGPGVYFAFVTGLTIGYGDLAPTRAATRILAVLAGFLGIAVTGLVAALAVAAFDATRVLRGIPSDRAEEDGTSPSRRR